MSRAASAYDALGTAAFICRLDIHHHMLPFFQRPAEILVPVGLLAVCLGESLPIPSRYWARYHEGSLKILV